MAASDDYQEWINKRHKGEWDDGRAQRPRFDNTVASTLLGGALANRLFGGNQNDKR